MAAGLHIYEEVTLLALREQAGTVIGSSMFPYAVAGAIVAELLITGRIRVEDPRKALVEMAGDGSMDDPLLDECLQRIRTARRRARLRDWVSRLVGIKHLKSRAVAGLCQRGVLGVDEKQILLVFRQKVYPEIDPRPEREIIERMRRAIFTDVHAVEARTVVLVALAQATDLLRVHFTRGELKGRKARIKALISAEVVGKATKEAIQAMQAAVVATSVAVSVAATAASH